MQKPPKPRPDFPLFPHASGQWAKKIKGKIEYFGVWADPDAAEARYLGRVGESEIVPDPPKVAKPYEEFPLTPHLGAKQWCKKIRGRIHYFGPLADWQAALRLYQDQIDDLRAGRKPRPKDGLTVNQLVGLFLHDRKRKAEAGRINARTVDDYQGAISRMFAIIKPERVVTDLAPHDFADLVAHLSKTRGAYSLFGDITRIRTLFKFGDENYHVKPHYGSAFNKPSKAELRRAREKMGQRMYTAKQIRQMIAAASIPLKAMIYLGINCGFGNEDCATLPLDRIDLEKGWHTYGRKKTGVPRRCPLWPETVAAIREALAVRPKAKTKKEAKLVFLTHHGRSWSQIERNDSVLSKELAKVAGDLGFYRKGLGFYALRHTFQTIAEESGDATATSFIMGHAPRSEDMAAIYRERMSRKRLVRTVKYVRRWLFKKGKKRRAPHEGSSPHSQECPAASVADDEPVGEQVAPSAPA